MIYRFLNDIKKTYECKKVNVGVFENVKVEGSKIHIEAYDLSGMGRIALIEVKGFLNLWQMQSMIVNPLAKDAPIYYYHRHNRKGNDIYKVEVLNTLLDDRELGMFAPVLEKYAEIPDMDDKENWYDEIKMPGTVLKKINKSEKEKIDELAVEHFNAYKKVLMSAPECSKSAKKTEMKEFIDGLIEWSGIAVLQLFRAYYDKMVAKKLCTDVLFDVK